MAKHDSAILLVRCPDAKGLVAGVAGFLYEHGANILSTDEHRDDESGQFLMRVEWDLEGFGLNRENFAWRIRRSGCAWRCSCRSTCTA